MPDCESYFVKRESPPLIVRELLCPFFESFKINCQDKSEDKFIILQIIGNFDL